MGDDSHMWTFGNRVVYRRDGHGLVLIPICIGEFQGRCVDGYLGIWRYGYLYAVA